MPNGLLTGWSREQYVCVDPKMAFITGFYCMCLQYVSMYTYGHQYGLVRTYVCTCMWNPGLTLTVGASSVTPRDLLLILEFVALI